MLWANFLHVYQPPTQKKEWVKKIADESYRKVFPGLLHIDRARLTLNINGVLCDLLASHGGKDVLETIKRLLKKGAIELTGSARYHAFLPLLPESEIRRQILLNEESMNHYFGEGWKSGGFFAPEMAYSEKVLRVASELGYRWFIMDEIAYPMGRRFVPNILHRIQGFNNTHVFFRERDLSFSIASAQVRTVSAMLHQLQPRLNGEEYIVTAMDGEIFGHHHLGLEEFLFDLMRDPRIEPVRVSDLLTRINKEETIMPRPSTWASTKKDMKNNIPFCRWLNNENVIQKSQWELTNLALRVVGKSPGDISSRKALDQALHSDQYWWASIRPWWSLEMIERGANALRTVILGAKGATEKEKQHAGDLYTSIIFTGFEWQRSGYVDELSRSESEEIREKLDEKGKYFMTQEEYRRMIDVLKGQMKEAATVEDFHRAARIKDRIQEWHEEMMKAHGHESPRS